MWNFDAMEQYALGRQREAWQEADRDRLLRQARGTRYPLFGPAIRRLGTFLVALGCRLLAAGAPERDPYVALPSIRPATTWRT